MRTCVKKCSSRSRIAGELPIKSAGTDSGRSEPLPQRGIGCYKAQLVWLRHVSQGFTVKELVIIMVCVFTLLAMIFPAIARSKQRSRMIGCTCNLKQIGLSFRTWALDHHNQYPMTTSVTNGGTMEAIATGIAYVHFQVLSNELGSPSVLVCPADSSRIKAPSFERMRNQNLSYFIGLDATDTNPNLVLAGDDNLLVNGVPPKSRLVQLATNSVVAWSASRHRNQGNIALADGSVQQFSSSRLSAALGAGGPVTQQLLMP